MDLPSLMTMIGVQTFAHREDSHHLIRLAESRLPHQRLRRRPRLDNSLLLFVHEHAEANLHKNNNLALILAGHAGKMKTGLHTRTTGTLGDLYLTMSEEILGARIGKFPTAQRKLTEIV
ncbi:MAG: hypothetical protein U0Q16_10380 [Bryobacteraceae bacterium]